MRQIIPATFAHVNFITDLLVREYQKLNAELGTAFYQSDAEHLASHVDARIQEDGVYKYFVLVDEGGTARLSFLARDETERRNFDAWSKVGRKC